MAELALGTAKIGLRSYGVGSSVVMDEAAILGVFEARLELGIRWVDTAQAYGDAEELCAGRGGRFITKILPFASCHPDHLVRLIDSLMAASAERLDVRPAVVLLHTESQIADATIPQALATSGCRWGISAYDPKWARMALAKGATALEFPLHVLNQQFLDVAAEAKAQGCLTIARSPFAGGALLRVPVTLPVEWQAPVRVVQDRAGDLGIAMAELCFRWAWQQAHIDVLVVGVSSAAQLRQIHAWSLDDHLGMRWSAHFDGPALDHASLWATS